MTNESRVFGVYLILNNIKFKAGQIVVLALCFMATVASLISANMIERSVPGWRSFIALATGPAFGVLLLILINLAFKRFSIHIPSKFIGKDSVMGLYFGAIAFFVSILIVILTEKISLNYFSLVEILKQLMFQVRPVLIEEIGFRYGLVLLSSSFYGLKYGLISGSIPFGFLHLLNFLSGQPIYWEYILGTAVAGLFLTALFIRFGLGAAILAHYFWNCLASISSTILNIPQEKIEGGIGTLSVLIILSLFLLYRIITNPKSNWLQKEERL